MAIDASEVLGNGMTQSSFCKGIHLSVFLF